MSVDALCILHLQQRSHCSLTFKTAQKLACLPLSALQKPHSSFTKFV
jgi:hypothetical protein